MRVLIRAFIWIKHLIFGKKKYVISWDKADYYIPGGTRKPPGPAAWGDHIEWETTEWEADGVARVWGHCTPRPSVNQTVLAECENSWVVFIFSSIKYCKDPDDMFFADILPIAQKNKESGYVSKNPNFDIEEK